MLGLRVEQTEGARFWLGVLNELRSRGVEDILIAVVDGLKGFTRGDRGGVPADADADLHRASDPQFAGGGELEGPQGADAVAERGLPSAATAEAAEAALDACEASPWAKRCPMIAPMWRRAWAYVVPFFAFPPAIRKMIYPTNAVESLNRSLRKVVKARGSFPSDGAVLKLL